MKQVFFFMLAIAFIFRLNAQTQTISGNIYDDASKAPLIGVVVQVLNTDPLQGAVTDSLGHFQVDSVTVGRHNLKISYLSYEEKLLNDIEVTAGKQVILNIGLQENVHTMKDVTIAYDRGKDKNKTLNDMALVSARSFNVDETKQYAGALGDPSRMAANYSGVISGNDSRNDIVVRGNSPTGMLWDVEGMDVPNPNHFGTLNSTGGPVSMLNSNNIDKSDFFTGAFPAQYGNALAGVFDIRLRDGNTDKPEYVAQVGFNGFEGGAEGPLGKNTSYVINYRYSTLQVFNQLGINIGTGNSIPVYQDLNFKIMSHLSKKTKLSFFGIDGKSNVNFLGKDIDSFKPNLYSGNPYQNQYVQFATTIQGLALEHQISDRSSLKFILGYCTTYQHYNEDSISYADRSTFPNEYAKFTTGKLSLQGTYLHKFNAKNNIQAGFTIENTSFYTNYTHYYPGLPPYTYENETGNMMMEQAYAQWKHRFNRKFSFTGGMHFQLLNLNNSFAAEPRAAFRYAINPRNAVSLGYGLHQQAENVYTYYIQTPTSNGTAYTNKNLGFTRSQHLVAEYDHNFTEHMRIKIEAYYQYLDKVPVTITPSSYSYLNQGADFSLDNTDSLVNKGSGYNYGAEITIEHFLHHGFYVLVTGSLLDSRYKGSDGIERNTAFNTGYVANMLAGKEYKISPNSVLSINFKLTLIGGKYLTPVNESASALVGTAVYHTNEAYSVKQPDYFRADLKFGYKREYKHSTIEFSLDLENITNHQNVFNQSYDPQTHTIVNNYQQAFFPVPTFRFTF